MIDYKKISAPVAKMNSIQVLLSITANMSLELHCLDVKNVFLHCELNER